MKNKTLILSIAAGAALLAGAAVIIARKRTHKKYQSHLEETKSNFRSKLNELQRKAQKEFKNSADTKDVVNAAKDRATDWVNKASRA